MGGSQSSRKLSVENENTIQVSQEALDRIQTQLTSKARAQQPQYGGPPPQYYPPPQSNQDYAAEEAYWTRRIEALKRSHDRINSHAQVEYAKAMRNAEQLFNMANDDKITGSLPPCQDEKAKVLECYTQNPNKSLQCSVVVNKFNECVCRSRIAAVSAS